MRKYFIIMSIGLMMGLAPLAFAEDVQDPSQCNQGTGATVTRDAAGGTVISGISSSVEVVDNQRVQGSAEGTLRVNWSGTGRGQTSVPGAPEIPANMMFGSGLFILGFGLILYRKIW